ncbi:MAG: hypothetical protein R3243_15470 [Arenibacter latericius]|nr:hypothetical protein [Arenibacter latericius]
MRNNKGQFGKGNKGRPKGTKNKSTLPTKQMIADYFENGGLAKLISDIEELEGKDKVGAKIKLLDYYMPKLKAVEVKAEVNNPSDSLTKQEIKEQLEKIRHIRSQKEWDSSNDGN